MLSRVCGDLNPLEIWVQTEPEPLENKHPGSHLILRRAQRFCFLKMRFIFFMFIDLTEAASSRSHLPCRVLMFYNVECWVIWLFGGDKHCVRKLEWTQIWASLVVNEPLNIHRCWLGFIHANFSVDLRFPYPGSSDRQSNETHRFLE